MSEPSLARVAQSRTVIRRRLFPRIGKSGGFCQLRSTGSASLVSGLLQRQRLPDRVFSFDLPTSCVIYEIFCRLVLKSLTEKIRVSERAVGLLFARARYRYNFSVCWVWVWGKVLSKTHTLLHMYPLSRSRSYPRLHLRSRSRTYTKPARAHVRTHDAVICSSHCLEHALHIIEGIL